MPSLPTVAFIASGVLGLALVLHDVRTLGLWHSMTRLNGAMVVTSMVLTSIGMKRRNEETLEVLLKQALEQSSDPHKPHVCIVVNPIGGNKNGVSDLLYSYLPTLREHNVNYRIEVTKSAGHPGEIARDINCDRVLAVALLGGDGLVNSFVQGLAQHPQGEKALQIPINICPCGTGNGLATSIGIHSVKQGADQLVQKRITNLDGFRIYGCDLPPLGALSLTWGTVADHDDLAEDKLRWVGPLRLLLAPVIVIGRMRWYQGKITLLLTNNQVDVACNNDGNKGALPAICDSECTTCIRNSGTGLGGAEGRREVSPPPPPISTEQWQDAVRHHETQGGKVLTLQDEFMSVIAATVSHIAHDARSTPFAHLADGVIDLMLIRGRGRVGRIGLAKMFIDAEQGKHLHHDAVEYYKVTGLRIEPAVPGRGYFAVDGEPRTDKEPVSMLAHPSRFKVVCS